MAHVAARLHDPLDGFGISDHCTGALQPTNTWQPCQKVKLWGRMPHLQAHQLRLPSSSIAGSAPSPRCTSPEGGCPCCRKPAHLHCSEASEVLQWNLQTGIITSLCQLYRPAIGFQRSWTNHREQLVQDKSPQHHRVDRSPLLRRRLQPQRPQ